MGLGLLSRFRRPSKSHRTGLTPRSVRTFLRELAEQSEWEIELVRKRPRPAEQRCVKATVELGKRETLAPAEFAARARVAVTTVRRLLAEGTLDAWRHTPHRPKICTWMEKERRNRLTKKMAKKRR